MVKMTQVRSGSIVLVRGGFGSGMTMRGTVDSVEADIKNGQPGIDYTTDAGDMHWAYLEQIVRVEKF